jgi:hypothetical protein
MNLFSAWSLPVGSHLLMEGGYEQVNVENEKGRLFF